MQAVTWHGKRDVRVEEVPDPHELFGPFIDPGDVLGHVPPTN